MYSSNKTLDRFGIEYSYIASAMNSMLKSTNNGIKNISIDKTIGIIIKFIIQITDTEQGSKFDRKIKEQSSFYSQ